MEDRILVSTKQILGLDANDDPFDLEIITFINSALSTLEQLGLTVTYIEDSAATWSDLNINPEVLAMVRAYILLKTRMAFDPPVTSFHIEAASKQIQEFEWRISTYREVGDPWIAP